MNKRVTILAVLLTLSSTFLIQGCERPKGDSNDYDYDCDGSYSHYTGACER